MHGRVQREGESTRILRRSSSQHMRSVPPSVTTNRTVAAVGDQSVAYPTTTNSVSGVSFIKDGRKISVGDCALFKPPQDSPPFIGLIRWLASNKENILQLGVNWLYRPAELKLGKGILLDAAPNEIFYSFHKDEIPAASLLHPCRVAFLPKGVELPTGISSFVCRRVYDIENKCLWWLTDQDYINERQEEVDQLLNKTRTEMHATMQSGGRSPKPVNGPTSTSQLKSGSDHGQNSATTFPSQVKGKKRERGDQGSDPVKRERFSKTDDGDSGQYRTESNLKADVAKITEKGGLVDLEGVEKLIQLMQPDKTERKIDLNSRSILAGVMAATDKFDCRNRFVQLRGLLILDEWLQDIHKGKLGDGSGSKDSDKSVEEFLLVLLRALDKIPVNLHALQNCNIGKSVNHLRSHKNFEIQKKARSLVDMWKKRVEAEMNIIDARSGSTQAVSSWPSKSRLPEATHGVSRNPSGPDVAVKSSITQISVSKTTSVKSSHGENATKSASSSPGPVKSATSPASGRENQPRISVGGVPDVPLTREDKSSSSNQSHNFNQSFSGKDEGKGSAAVAGNVGKISSTISRHRKVVNGYQTTQGTGSQKDTGSSRGYSVHRNTAFEKSPPSALGTERNHESAATEGGSHKLIVKIPTRGRSPAQGGNGGSIEDSSVMNSRASSPVHSEKNDQFDHNLKEKVDTCRSNVASDVNTESWQSNEFKDVLTGSDEGAGSPAAFPDEEQSKASGDMRRAIEGFRGNEVKSGKLHEPSFSSMNALAESCAKYSEANSAVSPDDVLGMNLLASVATGEMSRSDLVSSTDSPERSTLAAEEVCTGDDAKSKLSPENNVGGGRSESGDDADGGNEKQLVFPGTPRPEDGLHAPKHAPSQNAEVVAGECGQQFANFKTSSDAQFDTNQNMNELQGSASLVPDNVTEKTEGGEIKAVLCKVDGDGSSDCKPVGGGGAFMLEDKVSNGLLRAEDAKRTVEIFSSNQSCGIECKKEWNEGLSTGVHTEQKAPTVVANHDPTETAHDEKLSETASAKKSVLENIRELKAGEADKTQTEMKNLGEEADRTTVAEDPGVIASGSTTGDVKNESLETLPENKEKFDQQSDASPPQTESRTILPQEAQKNAESKYSKFPGPERDGGEECASSVADVSSSSAGGATDTDAKIKFDLNEGFTTDDGKYGEQVNVITPGLTTVHMINHPLPFAANPVSNTIPSSITVAAAAKRPFVPPDDLLRSKGELGWKGSAATSAFRPAEPRKLLEMPLGSANVFGPDNSSNRQGRAPLDFDLNVPDERVLDDMVSRDSAMAVGSTSDFVSNHDVLHNDITGSSSVRGTGGLDLDLNRVDDANDMGQFSGTTRKVEAPSVPVKLSGGLPTGDSRRDFDLNDGPGVDDAGAEQISFNQPGKGSVSSQLPSAGFRMENADLRNFSSWYPPGNTYSTVTIPSLLPDRGDQPFPIIPPGPSQRIFGGPAVGNAFTPDVLRGPVLSSSPAMPFPTSHFQYPVFPFGATFPLPSATFSVGATSYVDSSSAGRLFTTPVNSQLLGPVGAVPSQFPRPYMVSLPDGGSNGGLDSNRKWGRQGLDLNAGPGTVETEGREESLAPTSRQLSVASSQAIAEEQARMYSVSGGILKRKEPDGGWDSEGFRFKQSSWQ